MRNVSEIKNILEQLDKQPAALLETQDLDFKEWDFRSVKKAVDLVVEMAVCMANGGGGSVVFGVVDNATGRIKAIKGVPQEIDVNRLKKAVYDTTDPKLTPIFEEIAVPEGTGRIIIMQVFPGLPPYTDTAGRGKIRVGTDCQPLTGTMRKRIMIETGETDYTVELIPGRAEKHISPSAIERLREVAQKEKAPQELLRMKDVDLLSALGVVRTGQLTKAGLLLAGKEDTIRQFFPGYIYTHLKMRTETDYVDRLDGSDAIPVALYRLYDRIMMDNPITTIEQGLFHFEYRTYPETAIREALMNAFCHADYRIASPVLIKNFPGKLEISNPGGFIGGVSPGNILHHPPVARNPHLVDALTRLRLVNRSNLGVPRIFSALLVEGKEPPVIGETGDTVKLSFIAGEFKLGFRAFVESQGKCGNILSPDHLLILQYLSRHLEIDTASAARICQRVESEAKEILGDMEIEMGFLERGGSGRGTYWTLNPDVHASLAVTGPPERSRRIDWESAKTRVLSVLKHRSNKKEPGLSNKEIRQITHLDRSQVFRLMRELRREDSNVILSGKGKYAKYSYLKSKKQ